MMYTAIQKISKDSVEIEDEGDAPPIPPYTGKSTIQQEHDLTL